MKEIVDRVLREDIGSGDVTTASVIDPRARAGGEFIARAEGVIAGWEVVREVYRSLSDETDLEVLVRDGERCKPGDTLATIEGKAEALLSGERTALNLLQRMSGIATLAAQFVERVSGTSTVILDTRKTAPGIRLLDKMAVRIGGAQNHRSGLDDMVLIKENHIALCGGVAEAVRRAKSHTENRVEIEVEVRTIAELSEAMTAEPDRILLDNFDLPTLREAVRITDNRFPLEASGSISLDNVRAVAETGVQFISVGQMTHSVKALDISFILKRKEQE